MAVVSSNGVCYTKFNGENYCYFMASKVKKLDEDIEEGVVSKDDESAAEDEIALLESSVKKVAKKEGVHLDTKIEKEEDLTKISKRKRRTRKLCKQKNIKEPKNEIKSKVEAPMLKSNLLNRVC